MWNSFEDHGKRCWGHFGDHMNKLNEDLNQPQHVQV